MQQERIVYVAANNNAVSQKTKQALLEKLRKRGFVAETRLTGRAELIVCIGGDGTMLRTLKEHDFPQIPVIGINTGHLGFFQELMPDEIDVFVDNYKKGNYEIQQMRLVQAEIHFAAGKAVLLGINEITIKGDKSRSIHLNLSLDHKFVERFSGDGILVATPAGSTAYNYALGGCIVDPRLSLLQVTPISPMNSTAYRSFTSSVVVHPKTKIQIEPEYAMEPSVLVVVDGTEYHFDEMTGISVFFSDKSVGFMRFEGYDFWHKVKTKFL